jgi:hypothetical protein
MPHQLRTIAAEDFLQTTVEGTIVLESSEQILRQIAQSCRQHEQLHVLIDATRLPEKSLSVIDLYQLGSNLQAYGFGVGHRMAILCNPGESTQRGKFFELVAVNRGNSVRVFDKREAALAWLNAEPPSGGNAAAVNAPAAAW